MRAAAGFLATMVLAGWTATAGAVPLTFDFSAEVNLYVEEGQTLISRTSGFQTLSGSFTVETEAASYSVAAGEFWHGTVPGAQRMTAFNTGAGLLSFSLDLGGLLINENHLRDINLAVGRPLGNLFLYGEDLANPTGMTAYWEYGSGPEFTNGIVGGASCGSVCAYWPFFAFTSVVGIEAHPSPLTLTLRPTTSVPEPASIGLFALGLLGIGAARRRRRAGGSEDGAYATPN